MHFCVPAPAPAGPPLSYRVIGAGKHAPAAEILLKYKRRVCASGRVAHTPAFPGLALSRILSVSPILMQIKICTLFSLRSQQYVQ